MKNLCLKTVNFKKTNSIRISFRSSVGPLLKEIMYLQYTNCCCQKTELYRTVAIQSGVKTVGMFCSNINEYS